MDSGARVFNGAFTFTRRMSLYEYDHEYSYVIHEYQTVVCERREET